MQYLTKIIKLVIIVSLGSASLAGCDTLTQARGTDLMKGIIPQQQVGNATDQEFIKQMAAFNFKLLKATNSESNTLLSPLSIMLALTMTANGAATQTLTEMQQLLGGELTIDQLNAYLLTYLDQLPSAPKYQFKVANSIWFTEDERLSVEPQFLQTNADYFKAQIYKAPFDETTTKAINQWVATNTDDMIKKIIDEVTPDMVMILLNALVFDAEWETIYHRSDIYDGIFTDDQQKQYAVQMMNSTENTYLENELLTGFIKPYKDGKYSFVAMLPKTTDLDQLINMTGEDYLNLISNAQSTAVSATTPKFSYSYETFLKPVLIDLGIPTAFSEQADFSRLGHSSSGNIYIDEVIHKTFIEVNERGTRAGAVTAVIMKDTAMPDTKVVNLNRPFMYAIIDNKTGLPLFIGTVRNFK